MADKDFGVKRINLISDPGTPAISIGTSTITYDGRLGLNASTVAISTDISIGGKVVSNIVLSNTYSVGIGTTVLTERLNVSGNANISGIVSATGFIGSGASLTGLLLNQLGTIDQNSYQYLLVTKNSSGTISSISTIPDLLVFNPVAKYLGIGTAAPGANLDVVGTGNFSSTVTAPTFQGTATTATNLTPTSNINTSGIITASSFTGNLTGTATTASGLTTSININTSGIITASSFTGNLTGTAITASGLTTTANINTSGIITATKFVGPIEGTITGIADTAKQLQNTRYFSVSGDVSTASSVAFNGTQNVGLAVTLSLSGVTSATYGSSTSIPSISVNDKGIITGVTTTGITVGNGTLDLKTSGTGLSGIATFTANQATGTAVTFTVTSNAVSTNTANAIVSRDAGGNFYAGIITATTFSGTATTATGLTTTASVNTTGIITANTFSTGISTQNIGFTTGIISGPNTIFISPYSAGISTGNVRILGNLTVDGTTYTTTQATIESSAKTIGVAVSETNNIVLDGSGITIGSTSIQKTLLWNYGSLSLKSSENFNLASGKVYQINDNAVLSSTELASSVVNASGITTVGTLKQLVVSGNSSSDAVRITQVGSGNALIVEDEASPDGTAFIVSSGGSIGIGTTIPAYKLTITNNALPTTGLSNAIADFTGSVDGYTQLNIRNSLAATSASSDLIATADTGSDTTNFIDLGINNSAFSSGSWTVNGALDGYLYTSDGSLSIGIGTTNTLKYLSFFTGGLLVANERVRITGIGSVGIGTTNPSQLLHVQGGIRVAGGLYDSNNSVGTASSVLVSTGAGVSWKSISTAALQGLQGLQGTQGTQGLQGLQGTQGTQGLQGLQGTAGFVGSQGLQGLQGSQGVQGLQGTQGVQGLQGLQGLQGTAGFVGSQGLQGLQGTQGTQGLQGLQGTQGTVGSQGLQGLQGTAGFVGSQGLQGLQGRQGLQGLQGTAGPQGLQGLQGIFGPVAGSANQVVYKDSSNNPTGSANLIFNGTNLTVSGSVSAGDFTSTSDINLKTNIQQFDESLSKVIQIRGVTFDWKERNGSSAGVIAQEVEKVLPELVSGGDTKTVNYNGITGALIEAIKELKTENDIMKQRLDEVYKKVFG